MVRRSPRELTASGLTLVGAVGLFASLFLTWSHQDPVAVLSVPGMAAVLSGVPRDADAWQVYSAVDVLLAMLALALALRVLARRGRAILVVLTGVALAFAAHALASPPTSGVDVVVPGGTRYLASAASAGPGETLAIGALVLGLVGLGLSSNRVRHDGR